MSIWEAADIAPGFVVPMPSRKPCWPRSMRPEIWTQAIFYMDIRTNGKDFERYYNRAKDEAGVRFVKSRVTNIVPDNDSGMNMIRYIDEQGQKVEEGFDIVVLSVGLGASAEGRALAEKLGLPLDQYNYVSYRQLHARRDRDARYLCLRRLSGAEGHPLVGGGFQCRGRSGRKFSGRCPVVFDQDGQDSGGAQYQRGFRAHRRFCMLLRHQYRRCRGCAGRGGICKGTARRGVFRAEHVQLFPGYPGQDEPR